MRNKEEGTDVVLLANNSNVDKEKGNIADQDNDKCAVQCHVICSQRWILAIMALWLGIMSFMLTSNMNIAIVCMITSKSEMITNGSGAALELKAYRLNGSYIDVGGDTEDFVNCSFQRQRNVSQAHITSTEHSDEMERQKTRGELSWDKKTRSIVLSSFYYGYLIMQIPGGWLAGRFGGKSVISTCMLLSAALTLLTPVLARSNVYLVVVARAMLGLCIGTVSPSICGLIGTWALPVERSRMLGMHWFGQSMGVVVGYSTSGLLCKHGFDHGWASIFYVQGLITLLFVAVWCFTIYSTPWNHPRISIAERDHVLKHSNLKQTQQREKETVPWRSIFTYVPVYAVFFAHVCDGWIFYFLFTCLPLYMKEVLIFDIESNGIFSCLPYVTFMSGTAFSSVCADFIHSWRRFSITTVRKIFLLTGFLGVAVFILIPGYLSRDYKYVAVACLCFCTFFEAIGITGGLSPNIVDIAPRYSSVIFGVSNTIATTPGLIAPIVVAELTQTGSSREWKIVYYIAAGSSILASIVYCLFANSDLAPWAIDKDGQAEQEEELATKPLSQP